MSLRGFGPFAARSFQRSTISGICPWISSQARASGNEGRVRIPRTAFGGSDGSLSRDWRTRACLSLSASRRATGSCPKASPVDRSSRFRGVRSIYCTGASRLPSKTAFVSVSGDSTNLARYLSRASSERQSRNDLFSSTSGAMC